MKNEVKALIATLQKKLLDIQSGAAAGSVSNIVIAIQNDAENLDKLMGRLSDRDREDVRADFEEMRQSLGHTIDFMQKAKQSQEFEIDALAQKSQGHKAYIRSMGKS